MEFELSEREWDSVEAIVAKSTGRPEDLIEVLHQLQETIGYIPKAVQNRVAEGLRLSPVQVYGVVTFYNFFTMVPKGRHTISVCLGTSCYVKGGKRIMDELAKMLKIGEGATTHDRRFSLEVVRCVGACALSPVVTIDDELYSHVKVTEIPQLVGRYP